MTQVLLVLLLCVLPAQVSAQCAPIRYTRCPCPEWCGQEYCERQCYPYRSDPLPGGGTRCAWHCASCVCGGIGIPELLADSDPGLLLTQAFEHELSTSNAHGDFIVAVQKGTAAIEGMTGLVVADSSGVIVVSEVLAASAAADAKISSGTVITAVNGERLEGKSISEAARLLRGPPGTRVRLDLILRSGKRKSLSLNRRIPAPQDAGLFIDVKPMTEDACPAPPEHCLFLTEHLGECVFSCRR